jgi:protein involved in polysaccharide export with SLBB domain
MRNLISILLIVALAGCVGYTPHPPAAVPSGKQTFKDEVVYFGRDYLISPGDSIEVTYHVDVGLQEEYRLAIGDQMRVEFYSYPQLDRTLDVRPDGRVTVPYKGDIMAAGLTPMEFSRRIDEAYSDFLKHPRSTVTLIRYGQRIRELKDAIRTATRGQSKLALVQPDGKISLPLIEPIMVAGKTIDCAEQLILV